MAARGTSQAHSWPVSALKAAGLATMMARSNPQMLGAMLPVHPTIREYPVVRRPCAFALPFRKESGRSVAANWSFLNSSIRGSASHFRETERV
jgi:hypothetical protein